MEKLKLRHLLALLGVSIVCMGSILTTNTFIQSSHAMQAPGGVLVTYNEFIQYVKANGLGSQTKLFGASHQDDVVRESRQHANINGLFKGFGNQIVSLKNRDELFAAIDSLVRTKSILGMQAGALKKYINMKVGNAFVAPPGMNLLAWTKVTANTVYTYFKLPYDDTQFLDSTPGRDKINCAHYGGGEVHRPNHGLGHGVRQGLYAVDIVDGLNTPTIQFTTQMGQNIQAWVQAKMASDPHFKEKVEFASAFQRTGRRSEKDGGPTYIAYMRDDVNFFIQEAQTYAGPGGMFENDLMVFANALSPDQLTTMDALYLKKIFLLSHRLDLRRLTYNSTVGSFQETFADEFFEGNGVYQGGEKKFIDVLWGRAGEYLRATDRDRDPSVKTHMQRNPAVMCDLGRNPDKLAQTLVSVRGNTNYRF